MNFNVDYLRMSTPLSTQSIKFKNSQDINFDYLQFKLNTILMTLQTQKEELEQKHLKEKQVLQNNILEKQNQINIIQQRNLKIQQQCRQLKFNYHQRGSIIDYLKKKIQEQQEKFQSQRQQMKSIIKYLQQSNEELNKNLENANKQINNMILLQTPKVYTSRNSLFCKKSNYNEDAEVQTRRMPERHYFPYEKHLTKYKQEKKSYQYKQENKKYHVDQKNPFQLKNFFQQDNNYNEQKQSQCEDFLDCTIKNQQKMNKSNSYKTIYANPKHYYVQKNDAKSVFQKHSKESMRLNTPIFINNYGHMRITDLNLESLNEKLPFQTYRKQQKSIKKTPNQIYSELKNKNNQNYR